MGWLGPQALAAGALGTNLYFALLIFGIGLVSATSPLAAQELAPRVSCALHSLLRRHHHGRSQSEAVQSLR